MEKANLLNYKKSFQPLSFECSNQFLGQFNNGIRSNAVDYRWNIASLRSVNY